MEAIDLKYSVIGVGCCGFAVVKLDFTIVIAAAGNNSRPIKQW